MLTLEGTVPNMVEQGWTGGDLRQWLLHGPNAKQGKNGPYNVIPFGHGTPGTFLDDDLTIACGTGAIRLLRLQREGKVIHVVADAATGATGNARVFTGGDAMNGGKEVVNAAAEGQNAARAIDA